ncbi:hypothetical protein JTE90_011740 [Oedothorax gibbosus]|uniref:Kinetochore protein Spc24 n=1 Tax=Oedothorax gibbosus TaxID=931172 RepID=A0AAV6U0U7_9ARAC|nr:hypothetical protein JTE90_011740 [Oedothorax gibbosus]
MLGYRSLLKVIRRNMNPNTNSNEHWKERCFRSLKKIEEKNGAARNTQNEKLNDLMKKKEKDELELKRTQDKIQELEAQSNMLNRKNPNHELIKSSVLKLFQQSTHLIFDQKSSPNKVKGFVVGQPLNTFNIDTTKHTQQYVVDYLWKLIDSEIK